METQVPQSELPTSTHTTLQTTAKIAKEARLRFAMQWAAENPQGSINSARKALLERFGKAIGTAKISRILHDAHGTVSKKRAKPGKARFAPPPVKEEAPIDLNDAVRLMASMGVRRIILHEDGTYDLRREVDEQGKL